MHLGIIFSNHGNRKPEFFPPDPPKTGPSFATKAGIAGTVGLLISHVSLWAGRKVLNMSFAEPENSSKRQALRIAGIALIALGAVAGFAGSVLAGASVAAGVYGVTGFIGLPLALAAGALTTGLSLYSIFSQIHQIGIEDRSAIAS